MAYTDMTTGYFSYKALLPYQNLNLLADNDEFDTLAGGTGMIFPQATAPIGWVRQETVNDSFIRIVDSYVGSGGADGLSVGLLLQHTHTTSAHGHNLTSHTHLIDYTTASSGISATAVGTDSSTNDRLFTITGGGGTTSHLKNITEAGVGSPSDGATPNTDSQLSDTIFKYLDTLYCVKGS
jgi:hypothetical protein